MAVGATEEEGAGLLGVDASGDAEPARKLLGLEGEALAPRRPVGAAELPPNQPPTRVTDTAVPTIRRPTMTAMSRCRRTGADFR